MAAAEKLKAIKWQKLRSVLSHVGLLVALAVYTTLGGVVFRMMERPAEESRMLGGAQVVTEARRRLISALTNHTASCPSSSTFPLEEEILRYESALQTAADAGIPLGAALWTAEGEEALPLRWDYLQSVFFASTVLTTIGYGNIAPVTFGGRAFCILFALIGIPLTLTVIADLGRIFATAVAELIRRLRRLFPLLASKEASSPGAISAPAGFLRRAARSLSAVAAVACLLVYLAFGAAVFTLWEQWTFFEGFYFCFITMTTIGFGDLVPQEPKYMLICTLYILVGLALTSTIIELMRRQYARSWRRMKELSARLQSLSAPLAETLRRLGEQQRGGDGVGIDLSLLQDLRDLKKTLAMTRLEAKLRWGGNTKDTQGWQEWSDAEDTAFMDAKPSPPQPILQIIIYETSV